MSKQSASQNESQQDSRNEPKLDPFAFVFSGFDAWAQMAKENIERVQSLYDELADIEDAAYGRAKKGAQDFGNMMNESVEYMADLTREWRKLTLDATRRSAQMFGGRI